MSLLGKLAFWKSSNPFLDLEEALHAIRGEHDVVVLFPYDDGTFWLKGATFSKELIGGQGGYETDDGDKIVVDGDGEPKRDLLGVPMVLALDPTEHAAAVDPIKALVAQKNNIGEWLRVDSKGNIVEVGEALEQASKATDGMDGLSDVDVGPAESEDVHAELEDMGIPPEQAQAEHVKGALERLAEDGKLRKVLDLAPPSAPVVADGGNVELEEATHIAVDQSKAADLLPTTTSSTELNVAIDKARMEEHEEGKIKTTLIHGIIIGAVMMGVAALMFGGLFALL